MKKKWKVCVTSALLSTFVALNGITAYAKYTPGIEVSATVNDADDDGNNDDIDSVSFSVAMP